jgi:citrate synthase
MAKKSVQLSGIAVAETELCSIDPERGILMYRGYARSRRRRRTPLR